MTGKAELIFDSPEIAAFQGVSGFGHSSRHVSYAAVTHWR